MVAKEWIWKFAQNSKSILDIENVGKSLISELQILGKFELSECRVSVLVHIMHYAVFFFFFFSLSREGEEWLAENILSQTSWCYLLNEIFDEEQYTCHSLKLIWSRHRMKKLNNFVPKFFCHFLINEAIRLHLITTHRIITFLLVV